MKIGLYGSKAVKFPIHAPDTPTLKRINGTIQQVDAAMAPRIPPAAIIRVFLATFNSCFSNKSVVSVIFTLVITLINGKIASVVTTDARGSFMKIITKSRGYAIGLMSKKTGVNIETIRYYEKIGILPKPDRTSGGNRQYDHSQLKRLFFIRRSRDLGFNIKEIRTLFEMVDRKDFTCEEMHNVALKHLETLRDKITGLKKLEADLMVMVADCNNGDVPDCPIVDTLFNTNN